MQRKRMRRPKVEISPQFIDIVLDLHVFFSEPTKVYYWLKTPNMNFGGCTPIKLINRGHGKVVFNFCRARNNA